MTIELHDVVTGDGLFDVQGKGFDALASILTPAATTVPAKVEAFLAQFQLRDDANDLDVAAAMEGLPAAVATWQNTTGTLTSVIRLRLESLLRELVAEDADQPEDTLRYALDYLISQMETDGDYVAANTIGFTLTPDGSNSGDPAVCYSKLRGDGRVNENILAETLALTIAAASSQTIRFRAPTKQSNRLAHDWPKASGVDLRLRATDPANSLVSNGDFADATIDDVPDNWMIHVGTPGTTLKITPTEVQTIVISGSPSAGSYLVQWVNAAGTKRSTAPLAYAASGTVVQAALRSIPGLGQVTVSTSGTSPDYTHTVTMTGMVGNPAEFTSVNDLTGGSIVHDTTQAAHAGTYRGKAMEFDSSGSELTAIYHPLNLAAETTYFCHLRLKRVGACAAGQIRIEIVDEIDGSVIQDGEGNYARLTLTAADVDDADHDSEWFTFRLSAGPSLPVYLRIRISVAVSNTCSLVFDEVAIVAGKELYSGGPYVAVFQGRTAPGQDDSWTLAVANNRNGSIQEWYNRVFDMDGKGYLLPITGSSLIPPNF